MTGKFAQVVMGPAGSGKSTFIARSLEYFSTINRTVHAVNLDPAADDLPYEPTIDIRDAISVKEIMTSHGFGPNGGLMFCLEQVVDEFDWFDNAIGEHDVDYLLFDLPGQIELFCHLNILPRLLKRLQRENYHLVGVFLLDSEFMLDPAKFMSGCLATLSAMTMIEIPFVNVISKCDLLTKDQMETIECYSEMDTTALGSQIDGNTKLAKLTSKLCELIDEYNMLRFSPLDPTSEDGMSSVITRIDGILDYEEFAATEHEISLGLPM